MPHSSFSSNYYNIFFLIHLTYFLEGPSKMMEGSCLELDMLDHFQRGDYSTSLYVLRVCDLLCYCQ